VAAAALRFSQILRTTDEAEVEGGEKVEVDKVEGEKVEVDKVE